ncbi:hypothetical protein ACFWOT_18380 [Streptomyces sp. NPDC058440]|uniref:hypothetical protein n=1 Tax=Streptomyces sp. NPDC058440 TaxID=3346501 RepID=UPI00364FB0C7
MRAAGRDTPDALHDRRPTQALHAEQLGLYGFADDPDSTPEADFDLSQGLFLIARIGDDLVGRGGVRLQPSEDFPA